MTPCGAVPLSGCGTDCLSTGSSVLMSKAFFPDNEPASQNLGNVFFGLGALVTPALVTALFRRLDYRRAGRFVALLSLLPAFIAGFTGPSGFATPGGPPHSAAPGRCRVPVLDGLVSPLEPP